MMPWVKVKVIFMLLVVVRAENLIGYDCGIGLPNITTVSLTTVGDCEVEMEEPEVHSLHLQLLQSIEHASVTVYQCRVRVAEHIQYCGASSHNSAVKNGEYTYITHMNRETCLQIIRYGQFYFGKKIINNISVNATTRRSLTVAGVLDVGANCNGETYVNEYSEYVDVFVTAQIEISIFQYEAAANIDRNEIIVASGTICIYEHEKCIDNEENSAFWEYEKPTVCGFERYAILFEGMGVKVTDKSVRTVDVYFANSTNEVQFGLSKTGERSVCGYRLIETDHPRLFITEYTANQGFATKHRLEVQDILISAYFNTKISLLERHIKPDIFAFIIMEQAGYMAIPAGEVAHIVPCQAVPCRIRHVTECYQETAVECKNETYFLKPQSKIMIKTGTLRDCNHLLPSTFNIASTWVQFIPQPPTAEIPQIIQPLNRPTWKYRDLEGLMNSGIYTAADLERLRKHMIFPAEKPALIESLARKISDQPIPQSTINFKNLLDKNAIEDIAKSSWIKLWNKFEKFGIYSAGIISIFMIMSFIKSGINAVIHGYTLYTIFGWGVHLLGAILSSITNLIVHLKVRPTTLNNTESVTPNNKIKPTASKNSMIDEESNITSSNGTVTIKMGSPNKY